MSGWSAENDTSADPSPNGETEPGTQLSQNQESRKFQRFSGKRGDPTRPLDNTAPVFHFVPLYFWKSRNFRDLTKG